jgi:hypothetical protein
VDGTPAPGAQVVFQRVDPESKQRIRADALVEADGSFSLSTYEANDGAPVGDYKVSAVWRVPSYTPQGRPGPNTLPVKYAKAETSGLIAEVTDGKNDFVFELKREKGEPK